MLLNVKNAFNTVRQNDRMEVLEHDSCVQRYLLQMMDAYLGDRLLLYETQEGKQQIAGWPEFSA